MAQGEISIHFLHIFGKDRLFLKRSTFPGKKPTSPENNSFLSAKNSDNLFLVIDSFSNFYPPFSDFQPKFSTEFLQIRYFQPKNLKFMYFLMKTQEKPKVFEKTLAKTQGPQKKTQEPKIRLKNPRSWEKTQGVATLLPEPHKNFKWRCSYPNMHFYVTHNT